MSLLKASSDKNESTKVQTKTVKVRTDLHQAVVEG